MNPEEERITNNESRMKRAEEMKGVEAIKKPGEEKLIQKGRSMKT